MMIDQTISLRNKAFFKNSETRRRLALGRVSTKASEKNRIPSMTGLELCKWVQMLTPVDAFFTKNECRYPQNSSTKTPRKKQSP